MEPVASIGEGLRGLIDASFEWLMVRENGRTFPLRRTEMKIVEEPERLRLDVLGDDGYRSLRVRSFSIEDGEIVLNVASQFGGGRETVRLVPRISAGELAANVELARLQRANELAALLAENFPGTKIARVALNTENGRLAQIAFESADRAQGVAIADLTNSLGPELMLTTAALTLRDLQDRKNKPVSEICLVAEKKQARDLQKLHGLLNELGKGSYRVLEVSRKKDGVALIERRKLKLSDLWQEKPKKLDLPAEFQPTETAKRIIDLDPEKIDFIVSKQGETLRFLGLPFARVRKILGSEKAWFGTGRDRRPLDERNWTELTSLVEDLRLHRSQSAEHRRHELYRASPEAWLESILRRNIRLLDANLILSPLYNQFRASNDKIDLLAVRKDGRLVIIELKTFPDRETVFQAADYWRKIELQRRNGELRRAKAFGDLEILEKPALVYVVAPALSFHADFGSFARMLAKEIELWRFDLHQEWRKEIKVLSRRNFNQ
jgi:hypothetical protein